MAEATWNLLGIMCAVTPPKSLRRPKITIDNLAGNANTLQSPWSKRNQPSVLIDSHRLGRCSRTAGQQACWSPEPPPTRESRWWSRGSAGCWPGAASRSHRSKPRTCPTTPMVCVDGAEIGRAQYLQAQAAGVEATSAMNPVLLKPGSDRRAHVVVRGRPAGHLEAGEYATGRAHLAEAAYAAYEELAGRFDMIVCEGAGSPAEINLREGDYVNAGLARRFGLPMVVVGDIDRGGVFAALYGTYALLDEADRKLITCFVINKFRGDPGVLAPGLDELTRRTGHPGRRGAALAGGDLAGRRGHPGRSGPGVAPGATRTGRPDRRRGPAAPGLQPDRRGRPGRRAGGRCPGDDRPRPAGRRRSRRAARVTVHRRGPRLAPRPRGWTRCCSTGRAAGRPCWGSAAATRCWARRSPTRWSPAAGSAAASACCRSRSSSTATRSSAGRAEGGAATRCWPTRSTTGWPTSTATPSRSSTAAGPGRCGARCGTARWRTTGSAGPG